MRALPPALKPGAPVAGPQAPAPIERPDATGEGRCASQQPQPAGASGWPVDAQRCVLRTRGRGRARQFHQPEAGVRTPGQQRLRACAAFRSTERATSRQWRRSAPSSEPPRQLELRHSPQVLRPSHGALGRIRIRRTNSRSKRMQTSTSSVTRELPCAAAAIPPTRTSSTPPQSAVCGAPAWRRAPALLKRRTSSAASTRRRTRSAAVSDCRYSR